MTEDIRQSIVRKSNHIILIVYKQTHSTMDCRFWVFITKQCSRKAGLPAMKVMKLKEFELIQSRYEFRKKV